MQRIAHNERPPRTFWWLLAFTCILGIGLVGNASLFGYWNTHARLEAALDRADYLTILDFNCRRHTEASRE
jgi:hypothetical protein